MPHLLGNAHPPIGNQRGRQGHGHDDSGGPRETLRARGAAFQHVHVANALPALQQRQIGLHLFRALVAAFLGALARFQNDLVELDRFGAGLFRKPFRGNFGKFLGCAARGGFVKAHAERVKVGDGRSGTFGRNVSLRANEGAPLAMRRNQPDVCQLGAPVHEDDVPGLHVAMHEAAFVQARQATHNIQRDSQAIGDGQTPETFQIGAKRARGIIFSIGTLRLAFLVPGRIRDGGLARWNCIREFHHVVEITFGLVPSDMQHMHEAVRQARDRFVTLNARELAFIGPAAVELAPVDNLHRAQHAHDIARQPDLTISAAPDGPQQRMVGYDWRCVHAGIIPSLCATAPPPL